jgi:DNA-binding transcriptional LysR family regulator
MPEFDPFRGTAVFLEVADAGSFTTAAERLDMTKSNVSKSISRLEASLGVRLFHRTTRRLTLTEEGRLYSDACRRARSELHDAQAAFTSPHRMMTGNLRVSLPVIFGRHWVLPELLDIAMAHPGLELDISLTDRVVDLVEDGVDLAIRVGPLVDSASLVAKLLGVQQAVLSASPAYLERYGTPRSLAELEQHSCLTFGRRGQTRPWYFLDERGHPTPLAVRGRIGINDSEGIMAAALAGLGISLLSGWLVNPHLESGRLVQVLPEAKPQGFPIYAVWQKNQHLSPKVKHVVALLAERFSTLPWTHAPV